MNTNIIKLLKCPVDGYTPLKPDVLEGDDNQIQDGFLHCEECGRLYPIIDGVIHLVRDGLRLPEWEKLLAERYLSRLGPDQIDKIYIREGDVERTEHEAHLVEEGRYWSDFFNAFYDVGAKAIFDMQAVGTHTPFFPYGIMETDERDRHRPYAFFPTHIGKEIFGAMKAAAHSGSISLDVGCGGGQMALEAARLGMDAIGFDVAVGALATAARHANELNLENRLTYVYADPMEMPFCDNAFDLIVAKDSLHHLPDVHQGMENLWKTCREDAMLVAYEHINDSPEGQALRERLHQKYIPIIKERYGSINDIPEVIRTTSVHEDVGAAELEGAFKRCVATTIDKREFRGYLDIEQIYYFVYGKKWWKAYIVGKFARIKESLRSSKLPAEFLLLIGRRRNDIQSRNT